MCILGDLLGGRPRDRDLYEPKAASITSASGRRPISGAAWSGWCAAWNATAVAMLCGEDDPLDCHRGLMITPALKGYGPPPLHLRKDGSVETTEEMERRLLRETGTAAQVEIPLFGALLTDDDRRAMLAEAYRLMARRKAFRLEGEPGA